MQRSLLRRASLGLAVTALGCAGLAAPSPASAAVSDAEVGVSVDLSPGAGCSYNDGGVDAPDPKPLLDNGRPVSQSFANSGTATSNDDPTDVVDLSGSGTFTASATPIGTGPSTIRASGTVRAAASAHLGATATVCSADADASAATQLQFTLAKPMWATVRASGNGTGYGGLEMAFADTGLSLAAGSRSSGAVTVLVPAGEVWLGLGLSAEVDADETTRRTASHSGSFSVQLLPLGHPSAAGGPARRYVKLGARDCATGKVKARLTAKVKRKARSAVIRVNGRKVASYSGKRLKARSVRLAAPPGAPAKVVATVKLRSGAKVKVSRAYLACS